MNFRYLFVLNFAILMSTGFLPCGTLCVVAQISQVAPDDELDKVDFDKLVSAVNTNTEIDEANKKKLLKSIEQARQNLADGKQEATKSDTNKADFESAQKRAEAYQREHDNLVREITRYDLLDLKDLEQKKLNVESEITSLSKATGDENADRLVRRNEIREQLLKTEQELTAAENAIKDFSDTNPDLAASIYQLEWKTALRKWANEKQSLQNELKKYDAEDLVNLISIRSSLNQAKLEIAKAKQTAILQAIQIKRASKASVALAHVNRQVQEADPAIRSIALRSKAIAEENSTVSKNIDSLQIELDQAKSQLDQWNTDIRRIKNKIDTIGLNPTIGALLRHERNNLPPPSIFRKQISDRQPEIDSVALSLLDMDAEMGVEVTEEIRRTLAASRGKFMSDRLPELEKAANELVITKRENLAELVKNQKNCLEKLYEINTIDLEIISTTSDFSAYIAEHVLWIRSSPPLYAEKIADGAPLWFVNMTLWEEFIPRLFDDIQRKPVIYIVIAVLQILLFVASFRFKREAKKIGENVHKRAVTTFAPTANVAIITLLLSIPVPVLFLFLGWRTSAFSVDSPIIQGLSTGFYYLALAMFPLEFAREMCRPKGLAESHLKWPAASLAIIQKNLRFLIVLGLPLVFVTTVLDVGRPAAAPEFVERICFILVSIILAIFLARILNPKRGAVAVHLLKNSGGWLDRTRHTWYWFSVAVPLSLGSLAFAGYFYTAQQLALRLNMTICLIFGLVVLNALSNRWFMLQRRRILIDEARRKRAALAKQELAGEEPIESREDEFSVSPDDLRQQTVQSRRMLATIGFILAVLTAWFTWSDVLPALEFLERWPLWESTTTVTESVVKDGNATQVTRNKIDKVTIADLAFAVLIFIGTIIAARNLPGTLGMVFLQKLPIDKSVRYAITTLTSYVIVGIGIIFACSVIGLHWSQIQWIAGALVLGLSFGLQEMFANFIAGIIVLFEQPIRVGDVVTIGDTTGTVSRIRMRATSIISFDRKDFLVPNKEFITGKLLNWTLSDQITRLDINVGVSYGSDTKLVKKLLLEAAEDHPGVLAQPAPWVMFESFGDSSLNYILRPYVGSIDERVTVKNELNEIIEKSFREAGIQIPFPQRDVHIKSSAPIPGNI